MASNKSLDMASYFRTTVRNGYNTVLLDQIYVKLGILTYIAKWDVPCLVNFTMARSVKDLRFLLLCLLVGIKKNSKIYKRKNKS